MPNWLCIRDTSRYEQNSDANEREQRGAVCQWHTFGAGSERQWRSFRTDRNGVETRSGA